MYYEDVINGDERDGTTSCGLFPVSSLHFYSLSSFCFESHDDVAVVPGPLLHQTATTPSRCIRPVQRTTTHLNTSTTPSTPERAATHKNGPNDGLLSFGL
jgi:hypothetical protein